MEVRSEKAGSAAGPLRAARDGAASLDTQPLAAAAPPVGGQPALGRGRPSSDRYELGPVIGSGGYRRCVSPTAAAPVAG